MMQVVFMGTPDFALGTLHALLGADNVQLRAVFTQPDKPKGRSRKLQMPPVKAEALASSVPVYQPEKIREKKWAELLEELHPDVIVVAAYGQILPREILDFPKYGCINVHASLLPAYRGAAPIQWALINGEKESGVTIMRMDAGLDTGAILLQERVPLAPGETAGSLSEKLSALGARLLIRALDEIAAGRAKELRQPGDSPTDYARMLTKADGELNWQDGAEKLECRIHALNPEPGAWTRMRGKLLKIWDAKAVGAKAHPGMRKEPAPGAVSGVTRHGFSVQTGSGELAILELQPEGKKRMSADAFLRGYPLKEGEQIFTA